ncbi:MAG: hypothetical protein MUP76_05380 [Acidimicrobiia bacterium]|nr:hypothetical protein [Acidimicrobiia bacterium]
MASASAASYARRGYTVVETSLSAVVGVEGLPDPTLLVADMAIAECVLEERVDPARMIPAIEALASEGWEVTVLVPAARMGAAHWALRGTQSLLQAWWPGPADSIQFGAPQVP